MIIILSDGHYSPNLKRWADFIKQGSVKKIFGAVINLPSCQEMLEWIFFKEVLKKTF